MLTVIWFIRKIKNTLDCKKKIEKQASLPESNIETLDTILNENRKVPSSVRG